MDTPQKIGRYEILGELGRGAMGTVYRAKDPAMDRVVAVKTIISVVLESQQGNEFRERFYREARAAGALAHPGIVPVFDVGEDEGTPFLVMEFITGQTLADATKGGQRLDMNRACLIGQKIAEALGYAHKRGVVHRDIKPANILLASRETYGVEQPKITDFGVAKLAEGQTTLTGQMLGTPAYMPPEQFTGAPVDGRSDIFSLGVVLYWMATGEQPFPGESMTAVSYKVVHTDAVPPRKLNPSVPAKLESIILKCLAKSPEDRYQTAEDLAGELGEVLTGAKNATVASGSRQEAAYDPDATMVASTSRVVAPEPTARMRVPVAGALPQSASEQVRAAVPQVKQSRMLAVVALSVVGVVIVAAGAWFAMRRPQSAPVPLEATAQPTAAVSATLPEATVPLPDAADTTAKLTSDAAPKKPIVAAPAVPSAGSLKSKADAKAGAKPLAAPPPKVPPAVAEVAPAQPVAPEFDPQALEPKENAALKIDAAGMPATIDFTVMMNGKPYFRKTGAVTKIQDEKFFVPPGVQEFRVTARSGSVEKTSNAVSAEFKAKKRSTLKVELRTQGMAPGAGTPQGLYADTQLVVILK